MHISIAFNKCDKFFKNLELCETRSGINDSLSATLRYVPPEIFRHVKLLTFCSMQSIMTDGYFRVNHRKNAGTPIF